MTNRKFTIFQSA